MYVNLVKIFFRTASFFLKFYHELDISFKTISVHDLKLKMIGFPAFRFISTQQNGMNIFFIYHNVP